ncbi:MAG: hypothetical protein LQ344_000294 [Seirophora lacunosa]|nr:MAG: hypothetical protein LQ344_000294 [Seirophora lacunosa]
MTSSTNPPAPLDARISQADSLIYWNSIPATINGMLGGCPQISRVDMRGSLIFIEKLRRLHAPAPCAGSVARGVDCGAGIGRVTAGVLSKVCDVVDVVEPVEKFAREVRGAALAGKGTVGEVFVTGLQGWEARERYDLVWHQWCLGYLTDEELCCHLKRCGKMVKQGGWIVVKENMSTNLEGRDMFDEVDSSVTRTDTKFRSLFEESGLKMVRTEVQSGFPKAILPVRIYALQPLSSL